MPIAFSISDSLLEVTGSEASSWLQGIVTCDMNEVAAGRVAWGLLLQKTGKIQAELLLWGRSDQVHLLVLGGSASAVSETLEHYLVMEDAELPPKDAVVAWIVIQAESAPFGASYLKAPIADGSFLALVSEREEAEFRDSLRAQSISILEGSDSTLADYGKPTFGVDFGSDDNPHEASLDRRAVAWGKGCYLGQEVVYMQEARGKVKRRLVWLEPKDGGLPAPIGTEIFGSAAEDASLGRVTSAGSKRNLATIRSSDGGTPQSFWLQGREFLPLAFPGAL